MARLPKIVPPRTVDSLEVTIKMLLSVNRKYGIMTNPRTHRAQQYILASYRKAEEEAVDDLKQQLVALNVQREQEGIPLWRVSPEDRYTIFYSFDFKHLKEDIHNPLKPICDCLQKAGLILDDNKSCQELLDKHPQIDYPIARITIYKFHETHYQLAPLTEWYEAWLAQQQYITHEHTTSERIIIAS